MRSLVPVVALLALLACGRSDEKARQPAPAKAVSSAVAARKDSPIAQTAPSLDCSQAGRRPDGGYQFLSPCEGRAVSPGGALAVAIGSKGGVMLVDARGRALDALPSLDDAMPFVVFWAPNSRRFFVDHYLGSGLERLRVFEIVNRAAIERPALFHEATRVMVRHYPCLGPRGKVVASGRRWSRDSRRIALVAYARTDACFVESRPGEWRPAGHWEALWMIGDAVSGRIDPASIRIRGNGDAIPGEGPYRRL